MVTLWNIVTKCYTEVVNTQTSGDHVSFIKWSRTMPVLVFGTEKGLLTFYYKKKLNVIPCVGKHSKRVISGDWNNDGLLVTGAEDNMLVISRANGDTLRQAISLKGPPVNLCWARQKTDERDVEELRHVTAMVKGQIIALVDIQHNKINEINFQPSYGQITVHFSPMLSLFLVVSMVRRRLHCGRILQGRGVRHQHPHEGDCQGN